MSPASTKPVIFISYAHADEPDKPAEGEVQWLSFVRRSLQPAVKDGIFELWVDREMMGGADLKPEIERKLRACDIFILLVSDNSMASDYILDKEIPIIRERQARGDGVHFYPLLLTPTSDAGLNKVKDKNLRPRDAKPFSSFSYHDRLQRMKEAADEIAKIAGESAARKRASAPAAPAAQPAYVHIGSLPETAYERLVGRDAELKRLDDAWLDPKTNILSLVAEGGAGKSALVNEWLKRLQADNYRGASAVLGWSFYSQGTKERATSADAFLDWALDKLEVEMKTTSAAAKGEAIAEAMMRRRALLVLDGVEPLQHGPDGQRGQLKDQGLRILLRRFAATPPAAAHGLIVLTSRLAVEDIAHWRDGAAPVENVESLSDEAGAALLRDNGVWGTDPELKAAAHDFGGHPLALGLLASYLEETQTGDVRRRDHIRALLADPDNPGHDHAARVMESYEKEWLAHQPILLAIMFIVGLFDRVTTGDCIRSVRDNPPMSAFDDAIAGLTENGWNRALNRLREVRLLAPAAVSAPDSVDAHPLVRQWFGERFRRISEGAWRGAHGQVYEYLRDVTKEGETPTLEELGPLYQAIMHGCRAGRYQEVFQAVYINRICRWRSKRQLGLQHYARQRLGAFATELSALSWFFEDPYKIVVPALRKHDQIIVQHIAFDCLRAQGRFDETLTIEHEHVRNLQIEFENSPSVSGAAALSRSLITLSRSEAIVGLLVQANSSVARATALARALPFTKTYSGVGINARVRQAELFVHCGHRDAADVIYEEIDLWCRQNGARYGLRLLSSCEILISRAVWATARDRALQAVAEARESNIPRHIGGSTLTLSRIEVGCMISSVSVSRHYNPNTSNRYLKDICVQIDDALGCLRASGSLGDVPAGLLARAAFRRNVGDWGGAARDLDEVEEIAEPGPMRLHLCDLALERVRFAFARLEAFAPLNGLVDDSQEKPTLPDGTEAARLRDEARANLLIARKLIADCGYHRRDEELAELEDVAAGRRRFADLPPRV